MYHGVHGACVHDEAMAYDIRRRSARCAMLRNNHVMYHGNAYCVMYHRGEQYVYVVGMTCDMPRALHCVALGLACTHMCGGRGVCASVCVVCIWVVWGVGWGVSILRHHRSYWRANG